MTDAGTPVRIMIADDHELIILGLKSVIQMNPEWEVISAVQTGVQCINALSVRECDLLLVDYVLPDMTGIEIIEKVKPRYPDLKFMIISASFDRRLLEKVKEAGINGYLNKAEIGSTVAYAINEVLSGRNYYSEITESWMRKEGVSADAGRQAPGPFSKLTSREIEIVKLLTSGKSQKEIADILGIAAKTVEVHKYNIHLKMGRVPDAELTRLAYVWKLISDPSLISIHGSVGITSQESS